MGSGQQVNTMGGGERGAMEDFLALGNGQLSERERETRPGPLCPWRGGHRTWSGAMAQAQARRSEVLSDGVQEDPVIGLLLGGATKTSGSRLGTQTLSQSRTAWEGGKRLRRSERRGEEGARGEARKER